MEKLQKGHELSQSPDFVAQNIDLLKSLFPTIVKERKVDIKELQALLGDYVETEDEYYRFTWAGKSMARREANKPSTATLRPDKESSKEWDTTQNVFIEGDNLEVLKLLQKSYANKIKMIYIDPPYNTGKDFVYKDNYSDNLSNYLAITGQLDEDGKRISTNSESDGRYHSNWLNMMYPRLKLARNLLKEDGVIFISIDDNEQANLKKLCDEIFGEDNLIAQICHKSRASISNDKIISSNHNHILLLAKNQEIIFNNRKNFGLKPNLDGFDKTDDLGPYKLVPVDGPGGAKKGNPYYEFEGIIGYWRFSKDKMKDLYEKGKVIKLGNNLQQKYYLEDAKKSRRTDSTWWDENLYTSTATSRLKQLMESETFDTPKPVELIVRMLELSSTKSEYILDFFAGSGTTAHAVMQLNAEDGGERKFICVQLPEPTDEKSEAYKAGYKTISEITKERIRRAGEKIKAEIKEDLFTDQGKTLDIGFKAFKLDSSNIRAWDGNPEALEDNLFNAESNIKENRTEEDVLYEILLKYGLDLTIPYEEKTIAGQRVFNIGVGALFICLGDKITTEVAEGIGQWCKELQAEGTKVIFKDNGFTDVEKTNSMQILKRYGIQEVNTL